MVEWVETGECNDFDAVRERPRSRRTITGERCDDNAGKTQLRKSTSERGVEGGEDRKELSMRPRDD